MSLLENGQPQSACEQADALRLTAELGNIDFYNLACVYAKASGLEAVKTSSIAGERERLADEYARQAFIMLERSAAAGAFVEPAMVAQVEIDPDLAPLRLRPEFPSFMSKVKQ